MVLKATRARTGEGRFDRLRPQVTWKRDGAQERQPQVKMNLIHSVVMHMQVQMNTSSLAEAVQDMRCGCQCSAVVSIWVFKKLKPDAVGQFYPLGILKTL